MSIAKDCRRRQQRLSFSDDRPATVEFQYSPLGPGRWRMRLRDISASGVSFHIERELPGLEVGDSLNGVVLSVDEEKISGDLLVMHLSPSLESGLVCGGLFFPDSDEGILAIQRVSRSFEPARRG